MILRDSFYIKKTKKINFKKFFYIYNFNRKLKISKQKTRGEVNYSNAKPWKQKGTGKARAGTKSSPLWRGGGKVFAKSPAKIKKKINKKEYFFFLKYLFLYNVSKKIFFLKFNLNFSRTIYFLEFIKNFISFKKKKILIISKYINKKVLFSFKNIKNINFKYLKNFNCIDLIENDLLFFDICCVFILNEKIYNL